MKLNNLLTGDYKIVEKKKVFFLIPAGIVCVAIVMLLIYGLVFGSAFNLGMDFSGGYSITVNSTKINDSTYQEYADRIEKIIEDLKDKDGKPLGLKVSGIQQQGTGDKAAILVKYKAVTTEDEMSDIVNPLIAEELEKNLFPGDEFAGEIVPGDMVGATVSGELVSSAVIAVLVAAVLMLIYVAIRFDRMSGIAAILALLHDVIIMVAFMAIARIEINGTFIAALITIVGYSINNTIIIFDRIRENYALSGAHSHMTNAFVANKSIRETMLRTINTSLTTLMTISMVAILGSYEIQIFALPIIIGLLAGTYSSICISPAVWSLLKRGETHKPKIKTEKVKKASQASA